MTETRKETLQQLVKDAEERLEAAGEAAQAKPDCPDADAELWQAFEMLEVAQDALRLHLHGYEKTYPHPGPALYGG